MQESKNERSTSYNATPQHQQQPNYGSGEDASLIDDANACQISQQHHHSVSIKQEVLDDDDPTTSYSAKTSHGAPPHHQYQYVSRAHCIPQSSSSSFSKPLPQQPPHQPPHLYTDSAAGGGGGGGGGGGEPSWSWVHTTSSTFDPYFEYESSHSPSTSQSSPPPGPITSSYYDQLHHQHQYHQQQSPYHHRPHAQPPLSPLSVYSYQHTTQYPSHYPTHPIPSPTNLSVPTYYMTQQQRRASTSSDFSDMKSPINYEVLPPITQNIHYANPDTEYSEAGPSKLHIQQPPTSAAPTINTPLPRPPPPPITRLHRKSSAVGKELKTKSSSTSLRNRAKTSPSYLLDKRPPDSTGFVNYDARDGHVIMSAVAPSGNCKKYKNRISKKPSNAKLRAPQSSSKRQE